VGLPCARRHARYSRVSAFRILRPIERKPISHQPFPKIDSIHGTGSNRAAVLILGERRAKHRSARNEGVESVGGLRTAMVHSTIFSPAKLRALRRVDTPKANPLSANSRVSPSMTLACPANSPGIATLDRTRRSAKTRPTPAQIRMPRCRGATCNPTAFKTDVNQLAYLIAFTVKNNLYRRCVEANAPSRLNVCSTYVLDPLWVLACFRPQWPSLKSIVACFEFGPV
jgi:hypothetical protein